MNAKDLAVAAVEKGMSMHRAAKEYGLVFSTLQNHFLVQNRPAEMDPKKQESLLVEAIDSVKSKRMTIFVVYWNILF